jgi:hypothetical protein
MHYTTAIQCVEHDHSLPADVRIYSTSTDPILENNTVAFVIAKVFAPIGSTILLDAFYLVPLPGDRSYDDALPDIPISFVTTLGHVTRANDSSATSSLKTFVLDVLHQKIKIGDPITSYHTANLLQTSSEPQY